MADTPTDTPQRAAEDLAHEAAAAAGDIADEAGRQARRAAEAGKQAAQGRIDHVASALRSTAQELAGKEDWLAEAIDSAASRLQSASTHMRNEDVEGMADEACSFARRHPALFLGGAVALGFALSRVVKADVRHADRTDPGETT